MKMKEILLTEKEMVSFVIIFPWFRHLGLIHVKSFN